ncbi:MAG: Tim44/TimA family putative adaptor protein, partial [Alphaproteobacteria bacterium]
PDVYETFAGAVTARADQGLTVEANFIGVREVKLREAQFDEENREASITMKFVGELTSVVRNEAGDIVEGDTQQIKRQSDIWTFARLMGGENPNWLLVGTGA